MTEYCSPLIMYHYFISNIPNRYSKYYIDWLLKQSSATLSRDWSMEEKRPKCPVSQNLPLWTYHIIVFLVRNESDSQLFHICWGQTLTQSHLNLISVTLWSNGASQTSIKAKRPAGDKEKHSLGYRAECHTDKLRYDFLIDLSGINTKCSSSPTVI